MLLFFVIFQIAENKHVDIFFGRLLQEIWENFSAVVELLPLQKKHDSGYTFYEYSKYFTTH